MLVRALNSSSRIRCFGEVFNGELDFVPFGVEGYDDFDRRDRELRERDHAAFLSRRIYGSTPEGIEAVGFKLLYGQERDFPGLREALLDDRELRMVHLRRRELLRTVVSWKIATTTGVWVEGTQSAVSQANALRAVRHPLRAAASLAKRLRAKVGPAAGQTAPVTLTHDECDGWFRFVQTQEVAFESAFESHKRWTLYYEDIMERPEREYRQLLEFLGMRPEKLSVATRRQNPEPVRDLVANYDELREAFAGGPYASLFD